MFTLHKIFKNELLWKPRVHICALGQVSYQRSLKILYNLLLQRENAWKQCLPPKLDFDLWSFLGCISSLSLVFEALLIPHQVINLNSTRPAKSLYGSSFILRALRRKWGKKEKKCKNADVKSRENSTREIMAWSDSVIDSRAVKRFDFLKNLGR